MRLCDLNLISLRCFLDLDPGNLFLFRILVCIVWLNISVRGWALWSVFPHPPHEPTCNQGLPKLLAKSLPILMLTRHQTPILPHFSLAQVMCGTNGVFSCPELSTPVAGCLWGSGSLRSSLKPRAPAACGHMPREGSAGEGGLAAT